MFRIKIPPSFLLLILLSSGFFQVAYSEIQAPGESSEAFLTRLTDMLDRTEKSIKLTREQIVQSQSAPFLPQLYLQMAELLSQKSNTLYYIKMERDKNNALGDFSEKAFSPVVNAQKEAIATYRQILKEFPNFNRKLHVMYRLATALKTIDETTPFIKISSDLMREFPKSEEAIRVRLLMGQYYFEKKQDNYALQLLLPVAQSNLNYERNLAKYRIGLIYLNREKYRDALTQFEQIVQDNSLKEQENPYEVSLKTRSAGRADLKREALIDSIRAYTRVYDKDADPIGYYSRMAPTEIHFQEIIEKLSIRYINIKRYTLAVKLLRTLSERTADPQKIMNVYQEVLLMIPLADRITVPIEEIQYILEKYNAWSNFYEMQKSSGMQAYGFFEKQIRDFGTTSHSYAKVEKHSDRKRLFLLRAKDFYQLYLGYFAGSPNCVKIATNLADVYFALGQYLESGDYYLRVYLGEFGPPVAKKLLIENAILCFQKKGNYTFYQRLRLQGLLIQAVEQYLKFDPKRRADPKLNFAKLKAEYDQSFFPEVLENCIEFMRRYRNSPQAVDAGELILDYFNTRNEYSGLETWTNRMLGLKLPSGAFNSKLAAIRQQARSKILSEKVKNLGAYDEFAQGKGYLAAALSLEDQKLSGEALRQALARSKAEQDMETFMEAARVMAKQENNASKKLAIIRSMAREYLRVTQYKAAIQVYEEIIKSPEFAPAEKKQAIEDALNTALLLRDWKSLQAGLANPLANDLSPSTKHRIREQLSDILMSPLEVPSGMTETLIRMGVNDDSLLALFKAQYKISHALQTRILHETTSRCGTQTRQLHCRWVNLSRMEGVLAQFNKKVSDSPRSMAGIEAVAQNFATVTSGLQSLEGSGDPLFESTLATKSNEAYTVFGKYLQDAADGNGELKPILLQKAQEAFSSARLYLDRCNSIGARDKTQKPKADFCKAGKAKTVKEVLSTRQYSLKTAANSDPSDRDINELRKALFSGKSDVNHMLQLATKYYQSGYLHHACATASYGMSQYKQNEADFRTILGCSVLQLGLIHEASYHLRSGSNHQNLRGICYKQLREIQEDL